MRVLSCPLNSKRSISGDGPQCLLWLQRDSDVSTIGHKSSPSPSARGTECKFAFQQQMLTSSAMAFSLQRDDNKSTTVLYQSLTSMWVSSKNTKKLMYFGALWRSISGSSTVLFILLWNLFFLYSICSNTWFAIRVVVELLNSRHYLSQCIWYVGWKNLTTHVQTVPLKENRANPLFVPEINK